MDVPMPPVMFDGPPEIEDPEEPWRPRSDSEAAWVVNKLAGVRAEQARVDEQVELYRERFNEWVRSMQKPLDEEESRLLALLVPYALEQREAGRATIKTPAGKVSTRRVPAAAMVEHEASVLAWAEDLERKQQDLVVSRTVSRQGLGKVTEVLRAPSQVTLTCGCVVRWQAEEEAVARSLPLRATAEPLGLLRPCEGCEVDALVAAVPLGTEPELFVVGPDGNRVPGTRPRDESVSVSVQEVR